MHGGHSRQHGPGDSLFDLVSHHPGIARRSHVRGMDARDGQGLGGDPRRKAEEIGVGSGDAHGDPSSRGHGGKAGEITGSGDPAPHLVTQNNGGEEDLGRDVFPFGHGQTGGDDPRARVARRGPVTVVQVQGGGGRRVAVSGGHRRKLRLREPYAGLPSREKASGDGARGLGRFRAVSGAGGADQIEQAAADGTP